MTAKFLAIDNYDSFIYTPVDYLCLLDASTTVVHNNAMDLASTSSYDGVFASPGPGTPVKVGATVATIGQYAQTKTPILGVYLGHQALAEVFGGVVSYMPTSVHGKTSVIRHNGRGFFEGLPSPLMVDRYRSSAAEPDTVRKLVITARTDDGIAMGAEHAELPPWGVQSHPEPVLTQGGYRVLAN